MSFFLRAVRRPTFAALVAVLSLCTTGGVRAEDEPTELMPDDSDLVAVFQVGKILASPAFKKLQAQIPDLEAQLDQPLGPKTTLTPRRVQSVFIAGNIAKKEFIAVVTVTGKVKPSDLIVVEGATVEKVGEYEMIISADGKTHCVIDDNTVALGQVETLRAVLKRDDDAEISEELEAAWEDVDDTKHAYVVATLDALMKQAAAGLPPGFPLTPDTLQKLEIGSLTADAGEEIALALAVDCADAATAQQVKALLDTVMQAQAGNPKLPPGAQAAAGSVKSSIEDETLSISAKLGLDLIFMIFRGEMVGGPAPPPKP